MTHPKAKTLREPMSAPMNAMTTNNRSHGYWVKCLSQGHNNNIQINKSKTKELIIDICHAYPHYNIHIDQL